MLWPSQYEFTHLARHHRHPHWYVCVQSDSCDGESKPAEESDSGVELDEEEKTEEGEGEGGEREGEEDEKVLDNCDGEGINKDNCDDSSNPLGEDEGVGAGKDGDESETDTEDFTDSEDDTVEYMDDGEPVRKCKRGFKILQNCKRFWKASYDWAAYQIKTHNIFIYSGNISNLVPSSKYSDSFYRWCYC